MKPKTLAILASVAAATVVIAAVVTRNSSPDRPPETARSAFLFDGLASKLGNVAAIVVKQGDKEFTVRKNGDVWEIQEKGGYPVKTEQVRAVLAGMADLRDAEARTSKPELYPKLNVQDPDGKPIEPGEPAPTLVTLKDAQGAVVASAVVGKPEPGKDPAVNIRKAGEAQAWLARGTLEVPGDTIRWIDTKILEVPRARIKGVTVTQPDQSTVMISRASPEATSFTVADVPAGKELKSANAGDAVAQAIEYLSVEDFAPADQIDFEGKSGGKPGAYCEFRTFDGLVIAAQLAEIQGRTWARCTANYEETGAPAAPEKPGDPSPEAQARETAKKDVAELNARLGKWAYAIPTYKATVLNTKMEDLLKSDAPPPPPPSMEGTIPLTPPPTGG